MQTRNPHMARAELLIGQRRFDLAEPELRLALASEPDDARAHAWLALCLCEREQFTEATREAQAAVGLAPDDAHTHSVLSCVYRDRRMPAEALASAQETIRLEPGVAAYWGQLAALHLEAKRYKESLEAAQRGLQLDPDDSLCMNARAAALRGMGRKAEAGATVAQSLAREPENAFAHANMGWNYLHQSRSRQAMDHFREALRLKPGLEWARVGMIEALKARWLPYRLILRYFLFMSRLKGRSQWLILIGGYIACQLVHAASSSSPALAPYLQPLLGAYLVFAVSTWLAVPLFNLVLLASRFGRMVLSRREKIGALALAVSLALPAAAGAVWLARSESPWDTVTLFLLPQVPAVAMAGLARRTRSQIIMWCWAGGVVAYTALLVGILLLLPTLKLPVGLIDIAVWALVIAGFGSVWVANLVSMLPDARRD